MSEAKRRIHLNVYIKSSGHHAAAWRIAASGGYRTTDIAQFQKMAEIAERGRLDSLFISDQVAVQDVIRYTNIEAIDPAILMTALAVTTRHIGLIPTISTTYSDPFNVARRLSSLDHLTQGRIGWNVVTTAGLAPAQNFGLDAVPEHGFRYRRAAEFLEVADALWHSWEPGAHVLDRENGRYARFEGLHPINHNGENFRARGPLNLPRSPQIRPVIVQAGTSEDGRTLASRYADLVFTAQSTLPEAKAFRADVLKRAAAHGRGPGQLPKILPGIVPIIGSTDAEARAFSDELSGLIDLTYALEQLSILFDTNLAALDPDGPLPALPPEHVSGGRGRFGYPVVAQIVNVEQPTIRQLALRLTVGRGHNTFVGTPEQFADLLQHWFEEGGADGFNLMPAVSLRDLAAISDEVVPILRQRGLFPSEYEEKTLRERFGASEPHPFEGLAGFQRPETESTAQRSLFPIY